MVATGPCISVAPTQGQPKGNWKCLLRSFFFGLLHDSPAVSVLLKRTTDGMSVGLFRLEMKTAKQSQQKKNTDDFQVFALKNMKYKPECLFRVQHYAFQPKDYSSNNLHEQKRKQTKSIIRTDYMEDYQPEIKFEKDMVWYNNLG